MLGFGGAMFNVVLSAGMFKGLGAEDFAVGDCVRCVRRARRFPLHYRSIVILRDVQEFTIDEIAAELASSREAVKGRLSRAQEGRD